ncbi:tail fiber assembly protein [Aeromonas enteropelogenes]|uniref:tail fiber assembly protein n=1 Tax=Aeromonas enteropelogenes TaxID=29489 RepID=UPI0039864E6D
MIIYHYEPRFGCATGQGEADESPLDGTALLPAFSTKTATPSHGERQCARYLTTDGEVPVCHDDGQWVIHPDWRYVPLWSMKSGEPVSISEPGITPSQISATDIEPPGPEYKWDDGHWVYDAKAAADIALKNAQRELSSRLATASSQLDVLKPAVDGGYAQAEHTQLLADWQRYRYELTLVPEQPGWPESPQWPTEPEKVI